MEIKKYRTWRIIILVFNILIHLTIFLSLTNFKISTLKRHFPSSFEFSSFSEGKGTTPNVASSPVPKSNKVEKTDSKEDKKLQTDLQKIFRTNNSGAQVFNDSAQNKSRTDSVNNSIIVSDGLTSDTSGINNLMATQAGSGFGDGTGNGTNANIQMPRFMNKDFNEFKNWVYNKYTLFAENYNGNVLVEFRIDRNGNIKDINISNCDNKKIKSEILRIVSSSASLWEPAKNRNRPQDLSFKMVFNFYGY
jgi:hypothetical protein